MAFGLPIVSTDVNGIPEALKHQVNALLVKPGSIRDLKSAILLALEDKDLKERLESGARCTVVRHFDLTVFSRKLMAIYSEI
jgi:glycosyltransferase involved in cell wall biosynthesis